MTTHTHATAYHTLTVDEMPGHSHAVGDEGITNSVIMNSVGSTGEVSWEHGSNRLAAGSIQYTGGNQPHSHGNTGSAPINNLQPYIVVYMWRRTA